jgi:hypothetical protein
VVDFKVWFSPDGQVNGMIFVPRVEPRLGFHATAFVTQLARSEWRMAREHFNDRERDAIPEERLKQMWQGLVQEHGAFKKRAGIRVVQEGLFNVVYVKCRFSYADVDIKVSFLGHLIDRLSYLEVPPVPAKSPKKP